MNHMMARYLANLTMINVKTHVRSMDPLTMTHLLCRISFHEIWSCAGDLHSKDHEYLICIIASDCDDSLFKTHHRRNTVDGQNPAPPRMMIIPLFIGF